MISYEHFSKSDRGNNDENLLDDLILTCTHTGDFTPSIYDYTCTKHCQMPHIDSGVMKYDYEDGDSTNIDDSFM